MEAAMGFGRRRVVRLAVCGGFAWMLAACAAGPKEGALRFAPPATGPERAALADAVLRDVEIKDREILNVMREEGRFLNLLVRAAGARRVLEIGTSNGYAALWIALALEETGGSLTTIEINPDRVRRAKENLRRSGLDDRVTCLEGDAHQVARTLDGLFDFIYLDADKNGQLDYFNVLFPKLLPGGILICHNAIEYRQFMEDYLDVVRKHPDLETVIVSATMKDGFAVSCRRRRAAGAGSRP
jgi:predicted O-methyltransferase YrrM